MHSPLLLPFLMYGLSFTANKREKRSMFALKTRYAPVPVNWVPNGLGTQLDGYQTDWVPNRLGTQTVWYPVHQS
jgi:hypothetical protein